MSFFGQLQKDDVLFIDSSHVLKIDGDVPFLYLEVLPTLNVGVVVHIHDVPFPYNIPYPPQLWVFSQEWPMLWNEAMVVQAFLSFNRKLPSHHVHTVDTLLRRGFFAEVDPHLRIN